jgi:hypothetical protein
MRTITWSAARVAELRKAYEAAVEARTPTFSVMLTGHGKETFGVFLARETLAELDRLFAENPMPVFEPNREGKEGE